MTLVLDDPKWWPLINVYRIYSYFVVASSTVVVYDCVLTFGQEFELILGQRCSLMTVLYVIVRYVGILSFVINILLGLPSVSVTDTGCTILGLAQWWTILVVNVILNVIIVTRLRAMYQGSRKMSIFLAVISVAILITCGVVLAIASSSVSGEEFIMSGTYHCVLDGGSLLSFVPWILGTVWGLLALYLAVRIAVKHFHELQRPPTGKDCFTVLIKTHVLYFATHAVVFSLTIGQPSPQMSDYSSMGAEIYLGVLEVVLLVQMFVLGPRLLLTVREYHAKLVANSETLETSMSAIVFQELSTGDDVYPNE